jgi:hypothetical protein
MKKLFLRFFKQVELKNQTQLIIELLTIDKTPEESLKLFETVKQRFDAEMIFKREKLRETVKLLDSKFEAKTIVVDLNFIDVIDPELFVKKEFVVEA